MTTLQTIPQDNSHDIDHIKNFKNNVTCSLIITDTENYMFII